jgi:hypothetical protein
MKLKHPTITVVLCTAVLLGTELTAQKVDIPPAIQRENTLQLAKQALKPEVTPLPDPLPNPFAGKVDPVTQIEAAPVTIAVDMELLSRVAATISVSGTFNMGGQPMLLVGSKKFKIGDSFPVFFEGQSYDLVISAINPTNFSVQYRALTYTRATRLSTTPKKSRP